jgi:hypothetical protein
MDYSLLLAAHNITEEMKSTQKLSLLPVLPSSEITPINEPVVSDVASSSIHEEITTASTDSGIAMTTISNLPTYIQYLRVIEFIRAQQEPSILSDNHLETASITTVKPELSSIIDPDLSQPNEEQFSSTNLLLRVNSRSPINHPNTSSQFHLANGLIGGDIWYHRQNLSRLAMYVLFL